VIGISSHTIFDQHLVCFGVVGFSARSPDDRTPRWPGRPFASAQQGLLRNLAATAEDGLAPVKPVKAKAPGPRTPAQARRRLPLLHGAPT
jgi:hypothetical protein